MKTVILLGVMLFTSITLCAQETRKEFMLSFTNVDAFSKDIVPALSIEVRPKSLEKFDFMIAYASNLFTKNILQRPLYIENEEMQNIYILR
ncbi:hypothetical protein [Sulfurimonas sp.]|uniref:hypothetical protein n=1 Tax=Sulfurimonas sp. TaxID=2022749 RepID=UPI003567F7FD